MKQLIKKVFTFFINYWDKKYFVFFAETIKEYLEELKMKIIINDYKNDNRWFLIHAIKQ